MWTRLIRNDLRQSPGLAIALTLLIAVAAMLLSASTVATVSTIRATNHLWATARPPQAVQMHTGALSPATIEGWADPRPEIDATQVVTTLPIPVANLWVAGEPQRESVIEPALVTQPSHFDFLLGEDGTPVQPNPGEIVMPVHYMATGKVKVGDAVRIDLPGFTKTFTVIDGARDPLMNPSLVTSKRMVVHPDDFAQAQAVIPEPEHLVEFRLAPGTNPQQVLDAYAEANLPAHGIAVDDSVFKLMNALSTMVVSLILMVVAVLLTIIAVLALRYAVIAAVAQEMPMIGTLVAIGISRQQVSRVVMAKYTTITLLGAGLGTLAGWPLAQFALGATRLYLGTAPASWITGATVVVSGVVMAAIVLGCIRLALRQIKHIHPVQAIRDGAQSVPKGRVPLVHSRRLSPPVWFGLATMNHRPVLSGLVGAAIIVMTVPANITATIANPQIATTLGIAEADLRIDIREPSIDVAGLAEQLKEDSRVARFGRFQTAAYQVITPSGEEDLLVEVGDHTAFPVRYIHGQAPTNEGHIALSANEAKDLNVTVGQDVHILLHNRLLTHKQVSGIYQDITNGGKTAKAIQAHTNPVLWEMFYVDLNPTAQHDASAQGGQAAAMDELSRALSSAFPGIKVTKVEDHARQTLNAMDQQLLVTTLAVVAVTSLLVALLVVLISVLIRTKERPDITALRAMGWSVSQIRTAYLTRAAINAAAGILCGLVAAWFVSWLLIDGALGLIGAPGVQLTVNPVVSWLGLPALVLATVLGASAIGLEPLRAIPMQPAAD